MEIRLPNALTSWIKDFLSNRYFKVRINDILSEKTEIRAGVPQGAVLSPTLFSIFINDIPIQSKKNKDYSLLFADDLCAFNIYKKNSKSTNMAKKWLKNGDC